MKQVQINWGDLGANPCGTRITDLVTERYIDIDIAIFEGLPEIEQHERLKMLTMDVAMFISVNRPKEKGLDLNLPWSIWNSGGGCMIASLDYDDGSVHLSDEAFVNSMETAHDYWEIEDPQDQLASLKQDTIWLNTEDFRVENLLLDEYLAILITQDVKALLNHWK